MSGDSEINVKITADAQSATQGITQTEEKLKDLAPAAREVLEAFGELRRTFVEAFAVSEIAEFVQHVAELGEQAVRMAAELGMSAQKVQELGFAAKMVGGDSESMSMSMLRLERNMAEAQDGSSKAAKAFAALGISQQQLKASSPDQVLGLIANAFHGAQDGAAKTAIAMDLMGRGGAQMIPLLNQGAEGLTKMGLIADATGSVLTQFQAEGLEKTAQGITTMKASVEGVGISLVELFKPAIDTVISGLTSLIQNLRTAIELINIAAEAIEGGLLVALAAVIEKAEEMSIRMVATFDTMKLKAQEVLAVIGEVARGNLQAAVDAQNLFENEIVDGSQKASAAVQKLGKDYDNLKQKIEAATEATIKNTMGTIQNESAENKKQLTAPTSGSGKGDNYDADLEDAKNYFAYMQTMSRIDLENKKEVDQLKVQSGQMSKQQELQDLAQFTLQEEQLDLAAAQFEANQYDEDTVEYTKAMEKKAEIAAKYNAKMSQIQLQAAQAQQAQYKQLMNSMNSAFDGMVNGVLQGTQTWRQAMGKAFDNIALKFIDDVVLRMVEKWAMGLAQQIGLTQAFNAVMAALGLEQASTGEAIQTAALAAKNTATITSDAALAYAGVFANQAALLGPGASVPAAAAAAAVMAVAPEASLAVGAWQLDSDVVAQLHQGEMVVPQNFADGLRSGGGIGGGDNYNITIQAIDTQTGANFLKNNSGVIAKGLSTSVRNFNKNVPAWKS